MCPSSARGGLASRLALLTGPLGTLAAGSGCARRREWRSHHGGHQRGAESGHRVSPAATARAAARSFRVGGGGRPRRRLDVGGLLPGRRLDLRCRRSRMEQFLADRARPDAGAAAQPGPGGHGDRDAGLAVSPDISSRLWGMARAPSPVALLREWSAATRSLLRGETVTVSGEYVRLDRVALDWPPTAVPPLLIGTRGPKTLALAGELDDGVVLDAGISPDGVRRAIAMAAACRAHEVVVYLLCGTRAAIGSGSRLSSPSRQNRYRTGRQSGRPPRWRTASSRSGALAPQPSPCSPQRSTRIRQERSGLPPRRGRCCGAAATRPSCSTWGASRAFSTCKGVAS